MRPNEHITRNVDSFFAAIEPIKAAYVDDLFTFVAVKGPTEFTVIHGYVHLNTHFLQVPLSAFSSSHVKAGQYRLADLAVSREELLNQILQGRISTPDGDLLFPSNESDSYGVTHQPFHPGGLQTNSRLNTLRIVGADNRQLVQPDHLNWELRAADTPFDGLQDLLAEYRLGQSSDENAIEIVAFNVATVDATSTVDGETATLKVRLAQGAASENCVASYRLLSQGKVLQRGRFLGTELDWFETEEYRLGVKKFTVPRATVVHAIVNYNNLAQNSYWFADPTTFQNSRRAAFETLDPKLQLISDILDKSGARVPDSKNFEAMVPWLFWMLGFSPAHFGGTPRTQDGADFLLVTPNGHFAVVECTVGLLKDGHKLQRLHNRALSVKQSLAASNINHLRVLPIIITAKTSEEIRPDIESAEKLGIYVMAREALDRMVERTLLVNIPDQLYEEAEQIVRTAHESHSHNATQSETPDLFGPTT